MQHAGGLGPQELDQRAEGDVDGRPSWAWRTSGRTWAAPSAGWTRMSTARSTPTGASPPSSTATAPPSGNRIAACATSPRATVQAASGPKTPRPERAPTSGSTGCRPRSCRTSRRSSSASSARRRKKRDVARIERCIARHGRELAHPRCPHGGAAASSRRTTLTMGDIAAGAACYRYHALDIERSALPNIAALVRAAAGARALPHPRDDPAELVTRSRRRYPLA